MLKIKWVLKILIIGYFLFLTNMGNTIGNFSDKTVTTIDGPYVFYRNDHIVASYIEDNNGLKTVKTDSVNISDKEKLTLQVNTEEPGKTFTVQLKSELKNEKSEYKSVKTMLALSDIEGNFTAFKDLLIGNGVIDQNYNWTFGEGHLVLTGDFFDRGSYVTEVLWLIYSLEEKANKAGGHVHFILGNHEIMNLNGDLRYVNEKYTENAKLLNSKYIDLYSINTELGRWLRTKNIIEKIDKVLFMHGGISAVVNKTGLSPNRMNKIARPYYADTTYEYPDLLTDLLYSDLGPFWYRGYYYGTQKALPSQIDSTLNLYNVKHIATGHTIIANKVSVLFDGKLFNTDVPHAEGKSEALYISDNKFYRVNKNGEKTLLYEK
jgi:hypothetical protein